MVEFGEQLKRAREAKGMTQQTLAEQLYVTRQTVSRWECGDRFPDLITVKEISHILEVSLDDLLSDKDMEKAVERNPVIEKPAINNLMIVLYTCIIFSYIVIIIDIFMRFPLGSKYIEYSDIQLIIIQMAGIIVRIVTFTYALITALKGSLSPKRMGIINMIFFASVILLNSLNIVRRVDTNANMWGAQTAVLTLLRVVPGIIGAVAVYVFFTKGKTEKKWQYMIKICSCICIMWIVLNYLSIILYARQSLSMNHSLNLVLNICIYLLIFYQTSVLGRKREGAKEFNFENSY